MEIEALKEGAALPLDVAWGAREIADEIGRTERATFHLLNKGALPAQKIGNRWCADRAVLRSIFRRTRAA